MDWVKFCSSENPQGARLYIKLYRRNKTADTCVVDVRLKKTNAEQSTNQYHHGKPRLCKYRHTVIYEVWRHC